MDKVEEMLGYKPNRETRLAILKAVKETGKGLQQVIGEGKTVPMMPEMVILDKDGMFVYKGERMTLTKWKEVNPLGEYGKIEIIGTLTQVEKHRKLCT